ncbi:hypothetical protein AB0O76_40555 [Streptomyces sp. NPDC086554]|uniref:hypothetical protein n=1 Tax=Streptomyces sp. NPDC086554 TaxID=3154864 RepID=UPI00344335C6
MDAELKTILSDAGPTGVAWSSLLRQLGAEAGDVESAVIRIGAVVESLRTGQPGRPIKVVKLGQAVP